MNRSPVGSADVAMPADPMDGLLRAFFQAEMPAVWPQPPALPVKRIKIPFRFSSGFGGMARSRFALAASVGFLLIGSFFVIDKLKLWPSAPEDRHHSIASNPNPGRIQDNVINDPMRGIKMQESIIQQEKDSTKYSVDVAPRR